MPVEDVFTITGRGTVVTGRVERGIVNVNEEVEIVGIRPTVTKTTVTGVEMFRKLLDEGQAGDNVGLLLRGIKREDVERGQVVVKPGTTTPHTEFEGQRLHPVQGRGRPSHAVLQQLPSAVLLPHHGRDRRRDAAGGHRDGHARRQHRHHGQADPARSPWRRACGSRSARVAAPSAPAGSPRSSSSTTPVRVAALDVASLTGCASGSACRWREHAEPWRGAPEAVTLRLATPQGLRVIRGPVRVRSATRPTSGTGRGQSGRPSPGLPCAWHPEHTYRAAGKKRDTDDHGGTEDPHQAEGL